MNVLLVFPLLLNAAMVPATDDVPGDYVAFEVSFIECDALSWRQEYQAQLRFGGHQAGCSAWIVATDLLGEMGQALSPECNATQVNAPPILMLSGEPATIGTVTTRHLLVHADSEDETGARAAPDQKVAGLSPVIVPFKDGTQVNLSALARPEGTELKVNVIESRIAAVHEIETSSAGSAGAPLSVTIQVPEVIHRELGGEWLLPKNHGLLLSLGVKSTPGDNGIIILRERLLLIAARSAEAGLPGPEDDPRIQKVGMSIPVPVASPVPPQSIDRALPSSPEPQSVLQPGHVPVALAATPWGLLPIIPVNVADLGRNGAEFAVDPTEVMLLPELPSRTLPDALSSDGQPIDPRTQKDRDAERTTFSPYVDGQPVPSPQVTVSTSVVEAESNSAENSVTASPSAVGIFPAPPDANVSREDTSVVSVRFSIDLIKGFSINIDLGEAEPETIDAKANATEPPVRR